MLPLYLVGGLLMLILGAEALVRGSSALAMRMGVTPLMIGLTLVAFGTSSPELVVSIRSAQAGASDISIGNVVGSNICNITLILGIAALISTLAVKVQLIRREIPIMIICSVFTLAFLLDGYFGRIEGLFFLFGIVLYTGFAYRTSRTEAVPAEIEREPEKATGGRTWLHVAMSLGGLAFLMAGAEVFVQGARSAAMELGVSEAVIGLTIVAVGTSLPELFTSAVAAWKREGDIAIGNLIGSNIFNLLAILGIAAIFRPLDVQQISIVDMLVMVGTAALMLPLMRTGFRVTRIEGLILLLIYAGYIAYLV